MKLLLLSLFFCLLSVALVTAIPVDESLGGDLYDLEQYNNPQNLQSFLKLKKIKKLLLG